MPLVFPLSKETDISTYSGIKEVPYLHNNCFFAREVLEAIPVPHCNMVLREDGLGKEFHQDRWQMEKVVEAGYKIYVNYDVVVKHIVEVEVGREFHSQQHK
jgi:G:T-mismatch repair DNA endonuclease (very short patch repair protein)